MSGKRYPDVADFVVVHKRNVSGDCQAPERATGRPNLPFGEIRGTASRPTYTRVRKERVPGANLHASGVRSPEGCQDISPGWSVFCDTGVTVYARERTPKAVRGTRKIY